MRIFFIALALTGQLFGCARASEPAAVSSGQVTGRPDITPTESRNVRPFPPGGISLEVVQGAVRIQWKSNPLDPTLRYKVYRRDSAGVAASALIEGGQFVDKKPRRGPVSYYVTTVNQSGLESSPSRPVEVGR